jgi:prepilin signal peptidase PulO-like enzyme (type II secretory pathway)
MSELFGEISPLLLIAMIGFLTQFLKEQFKLSGRPVILVSLLVGLALGVMIQLAELYPGFNQWFRIAIYSVLFALSASGGYDFLTKFKRP